MLDGNSALATILKQVRRRALTQLFLEHGNLALIIALAALVFLMIAGTQVMQWYWPVLLLVLFLAVGWWRLRESIPSDYQIAQQVDSRLGFQDSLSTAYYFSNGDAPQKPDPVIIEAQRRQAESFAQSADPVAAAPVEMPRSMWASAALSAVALGLLIARYGMSGSLDLSQPLVHIPFDSFLSQPEVIAQREPLPKQKLPPGMETVAVPSDLTDTEKGDKKDAALEQEGAKAETMESDQPAGKTAEKGQKGEESSEQGGKDQGDAMEKGDGKSGADDQNAKSGGSNAAGKENAKSPQKGGQNNSAQQNDSSLMDKMKDAMANMLSRMRMSPQAQEGGQKNQASNQGSPQKAAGKQAGEKGSPSPGKMQGQGEQTSDQEGEQQGEGASKNMANSQRTDGASDKQSPQEGKSGAGKQDGEKEIKAAQEAAAINKISELLGKRAKDLTGEVMVEVSSGRQQLKTQMSTRSSQHGDTGGDVNRDEVPAAYQQFVQQYFEELRKPTPAAAPAKK